MATTGKATGLVLMFLALQSVGFGQANHNEGFDNVGSTQGDGPQNLINQGWIFRNQSSPRGAQSWMAGFTGGGWPSPQTGAGYLAVTTSSTDFFGGTVSNWAILPAIAGQQAGDELRFYALDMGGDNVNTLQVRYSAGGGTHTVSGPSAVGDFTQLLLDVSPIPAGGWNLYSVTLPGAGRIALRYYIASAMSGGVVQILIGITPSGIDGDGDVDGDDSVAFVAVLLIRG